MAAFRLFVYRIQGHAEVDGARNLLNHDAVTQMSEASPASGWLLPAAAGAVVGAVSTALFFRQRRKLEAARPTPAEDEGSHDVSSPTPRKLPWNKHGLGREFELGSYECVQGGGFAISELCLLRVPHLNDIVPEANWAVPNQRRSVKDSSGGTMEYRNLIDESYAIVGDIVRRKDMAPTSRAYVRAGPRAQMFFNPQHDLRAAIVTCGGLCPGLNNVIREVVRSLNNLYDVETVLGVRCVPRAREESPAVPFVRRTPEHWTLLIFLGRNGFHGFVEDDTVELTVDNVHTIHAYGGTILGAARGGFDADAILGFCERHGVSMLFIIGGDGTHRGAQCLYERATEERRALAVVGIPKTIDNDIDIIDRSFGFSTAVEEAQRAIASAHTEARCAPRGIGVVKLMGRHAGFLAAHASLASGVVDLCLVPEVPVQLDGEQGLLRHLEMVLESKGFAVVVVAEGAGESLLQDDPSLQEVDAGGNRKLPPIGTFLKDHITQHFDDLQNPATVKYIDPSYVLRSIPANSSDSLYCMLLAQNAVHAAMAGFTGVTVGLCNNRVVLLPITALVENSPRVMDPLGRTWERVISSTRQPNVAVALPAQSKRATTGRTIHA